ncbi:hypothetical protein B0H17DRAFT_1205798 [Mycena rosella]|uniref:Uncharacterized protein n=1 Tax=Mycena rosella TaxID=1033263 RepID=A0AAD7GDM3_MYCRO|nr:hypothetical protein B0H17DRAFT_1205798 [Mycena rosella]
MKFTTLLPAVLLAISVSAVPVQKRGVDPNLVPQFGISLSADVAAGHDVNNPGVQAPFPTDSSAASQIVRLQTSVTTLQNLFGPGKGCPAMATSPPPPAPAPAAPAPAPAAPAAPAGFDGSLVPQFGIVAGTNPTGTGDCDGVNGIKIPCTCPPSRDSFIAAVAANVAAGHDINNPGVLAPFPTDSSAASQIARLQTSVTSLQNLFGPGVGCPASATTFLAQIKALQ